MRSKLEDARQLSLSPIGYVRSPYRDKSDAPHQPNPSEAVEATIELLPGHNFEQALEDLAGMDKVWLIYWFDRNPNWKPKVQVPRGERIKRGVFATRSPHRPNPIGLTLVDLVRVDGLRLIVRNIDLLDGTPILDIKPYLPALEAHPNAHAGWIDAAERDYTSQSYRLEYSREVLEQLQFLSRHGLDLQTRIERVLKYNAEPHPYKRIDRDSEGLYLAYRGWRVRFTVTEDVVRVQEIRSGYTSEGLTGANVADEEAQRAFAQWRMRSESAG